MQCVVERPEYDLTIFKIHFGRLTAKIYSKGERVLRIEVIAHNTKDLRCGRSIEKWGAILKALTGILERFVAVLQSVDAALIDRASLEEWPRPTRLGAVRVGGVDVNRPRIRAVMEAVVKAKPPTAKGTYLKKLVLTATMGPGVKVDTITASAMETAL